MLGLFVRVYVFFYDNAGDEPACVAVVSPGDGSGMEVDLGGSAVWASVYFHGDQEGS